MFFAVVLSLTALAAASPVVLYDGQQQQNLVNYEDGSYTQQYQPLWYNTYKNYFYRFPNSGPTKRSYPFQPINYFENTAYPHRSNYYLRYVKKPETSVQKLKFDYDSEDIYHLHDVKHHHLVNNIHDIKQKEVLRNVATTYKPAALKTLRESSEEDLWDVDNVEPVIYKNLNIDVKPVVRNSESLRDIVPTTSRDLSAEYVTPVVSKAVDVEFPKQLDQEYMQQDIEHMNMLQPKILARNLGISRSKNYYGNMQPVSSKQLEEALLNLEFEHIPVEGRFKRDQAAHVGVEFEKKTPVAAVEQDTVRNTELAQQATMGNEHTATVEGQISEEGVQKRVHSNEQSAAIPVENPTLQPLQRQTRDIAAVSTTKVQPILDTSLYLYYPYFLVPYQPVARSAHYPYLPVQFVPLKK